MPYTDKVALNSPVGAPQPYNNYSYTGYHIQLAQNERQTIFMPVQLNWNPASIILDTPASTLIEISLSTTTKIIADMLAANPAVDTQALWALVNNTSSLLAIPYVCHAIRFTNVLAAPGNVIVEVLT